MPDKNIQAVAPTRRWVKILLALSLGLNMLIIGVVGGAMVSHRSDSDPQVSLRALGYAPYTRALSREDRKAIGAALRKEAGTPRGNIPEMRKAYRALLEALKADVYDRDLVHQLVQDQQAIGLKRQQIGQRLLLERLDTMTPRERSSFARRLQRTLRQGAWAARHSDG